MNGQPQNGESPSIKDHVAKIIYIPFMGIFFIGMLITITYTAVVIYYISIGSIEPEWIAKSVPPLELLGKLINPAQSDASRALDTLGVVIVALIMGVFLRRCTSGAHGFEVGVIVLLIISGTIQLILILVLPSPDEASRVISAGDKIVENVGIILARNTNVSFAILSAALGIQLSKDNGEKKNGQK